ncbi:MAG: hypothetical protein HGA33_00805 [Candidatus Moranbacteria bacterium]|nr:hypothetical protein [Candidatus Moranbacteria bacterium]
MPRQEVGDDIQHEYTQAEKVVTDIANNGFTWTDREALFRHRYKDEREATKSVYSSGELQGIVLDKACRIMAQNFTGRFDMLDEEDIASIIAANLLFHEHIIPNANQGGDFLTKERQVNVYSNVYGTMPVYVDWVVGDKYKGPDFQLVHPRRFKPQPGKYVIEDMDYCFVDTFKTLKWLEQRVKAFPEVWGSAQSVLDEYSSGNPSIPSAKTLVMTDEERRVLDAKKGLWLVHRFDSNGDWTVYDRATGVIALQVKDWNPGIPMVDKHTIPMIDSYYGLGDYERGETSQKTLDTLMRRYLDGVDMSIDPPAIMDPEDVIMSSIIRGPRKNWFVKNGKVDGIQFPTISPRGIDTFQTTHAIVKSNILNLSATTDTSVPKSVDPGMGKTPEALKLQANREGARDSWDRYMQERFHEKLADKMMALVVKRGGVGGASIRNVESAIRRIGRNFEDKDIAIFESGKIDDSVLKGKSFRYSADPDSSSKQPGGTEDLLAILSFIEKNPDAKQSLLNSGTTIDYGEALKRLAIDKKIPDWHKIIIKSTQPESVPGTGDAGLQDGQVPPEQTMVPMIPEMATDMQQPQTL